MRREKVTRLNRETFVYGIAIRAGGEAYAFNRDYFVLPRRLSREEVAAIRSDYDVRYFDTASGEGKFKPPSAQDERGWVTYFARLPEPLEWYDTDYPKSYYSGKDSCF